MALTGYIYLGCTAGTTTAGEYCGSGDCDSITDNATAGTCANIYWIPSFHIFSDDPITINPEPETEEQRQAREERAQEYQRQQADLQKEQEAAIKAAEELLKEHIGLEAFGKLHEVGYIELDSQQHKGRKYRVSKDSYKRIEVVDDQGKVVDKLCIGPAIGCPPCDVILARVVLLELAEEYVLETANHDRRDIQLEDLVVGALTIE